MTYVVPLPVFIVVLLLLLFPMSTLTKKEKRAYQRLLTGLSIGNHQSAFMRFMTLTSAADSPTNINKSFNLLKMRIQRAKVNRDGFHGFKFNRYFKLKTAEGHNVLHIIYWGRFIPVEWLKETWDQIHGAFKVDIRACWDNKHRKMNRVNGLVGYLLTNYLTKQPILRMSYGWKWAWLGFCKSWDHMRQYGVGHIRRAARIGDPAKWLIRNVQPGTTKEYTVKVPSFNVKYRDCVKELWTYLTKEPLPTTRGIKFTNPSHDNWTAFKKSPWFEGWEYTVKGVVWVFKPLSKGNYFLYENT